MRHHRPSRAFTLVDVIVTIGVVALLISLLLPGFDKVREASRRVVCTSNLRQIGLGLVLYADAYHDVIPYSVFIQKGKNNQIEYAPESMMTLRLPHDLSQRTRRSWDGLGLLYEAEVLPEAQIFYCPSHHGNHAFDEMADSWLENEGEIVGNYHYRGQGPNGANRLTFIEPSRAAISADGLRSLEDYNHEVGLNVLRADLSMLWVDDPDRRIAEYIAAFGDDPSGDFDFSKVWLQLDEPDGNHIPDPG